ncbi:hypothetical protein LPTSP1_30560 [Leptospira johnsonii]|uniref:Uncharacterized protein n=1 Tax=Leptospira johnsonii TaxID=1917820 RepID=A0A2P2D608_9LEPT|nr:hypothetical protein LPTSP1_30560 [Leptospira johnsonii]
MKRGGIGIRFAIVNLISRSIPDSKKNNNIDHRAIKEAIEVKAKDSFRLSDLI